MPERYNECDDWGNPVAVSVPCRITKGRDEPIMIGGQIPYFEGRESYRAAYDFLSRSGFSIDKEDGKELGIVIEGQLQTVIDRFGDRLVPAASLN